LKLKVVDGVPGDKDRVVQLPASGVVRVGRGRDTETLLKDLSVSRQHCRLELNSGQIRLVDLPADDPRRPKPTFVNDRQVSEIVLRPGDVIRIGATVLRLEGDEEVHDERTRSPEELRRLGLLPPHLDPAQVRQGPPEARPQPVPPPLPQGLPVSCQCGTQLRYRPICEGTWVRCPACGDFLQLPGKANLGESVMMSSYRIQRRPPRHGPVVPTSPAREIAKVIATVLATLLIMGSLIVVAYFVAKHWEAGPPAGETETEKPAEKDGQGAPAAKDGKEASPAKDGKEPAPAKTP
jgi:hypothetical protein